MLGVYAQELQALKAELQHTLARLGDGSSSASSSAPTPITSAGALPFFVTPGVRRAPSSQQQQQTNSHARPASATSWSVASTRTITTATNTPEVPDSAGEQHQQQHTVAGTTTWDARHLMHELRTASQRRRELEIELANEMRREQERQRLTDARIPWQNAIAALQRQRVEIIREIEQESQQDPFTGGGMEFDQLISSDTGGTSDNQRPHRVLYRDSGTQMSPLPPTPPPVRNSGRLAANVVADAENHYAIEGVVTLQSTSTQPTHRTTAAAPQHSQQQQQHTVTTSTSTSNHQQPPSQQQLFKHELFGRPESHHDALNEVFSIQLKFAETMLKLEKSVQIRDQLLQRNAGQRSRRGLTRMPIRRTNSTATANHDHHHHNRAGQSDSDSYYEDDVVSSDYDSFSSGASLGDYAVRLRRYTSDHDSEIHAATSTNREVSSATAPAPSATGGHEANNVNLSAVEEEHGDSEAPGADDASSSASPDSHEARTPSTENSDKTSNTSSTTKQVRFGDCSGNEYSTPVIARKFNFDNQSDDEHDGDDRESILSFMDGSSVTSAELNDKSLIKAFNAFRRELGNLKAATPQWQKKSFLPSSGITAAISAARALFASDESDAEDSKCAMLKPTVNPAKQDPIILANASIAPPRQPQKQDKVPHRELDRTALSERRRQLCLDIQAESAQLVLTFGSRNAHETERVKQHLIELRGQLRAVDEQLQ